MEEEDLEEVVGEEDTTIIIRQNREEVLTPSFTDVVEMSTLTHAPTNHAPTMANHRPIQFSIDSPAVHASYPLTSSEPSTSNAPTMAHLKREELDAMFGDTDDLEYDDIMVFTKSEDCNTFTTNNDVDDGLQAKCSQKRKRGFSDSDDESGSTTDISTPATSVASLTILNINSVQRPCCLTNFIIQDEFLDITIEETC